MAEYILGLGTRKSARQMLNAIDKHVRKNQGAARKISATARSIEVVAERANIDTPFNSLSLRLHKLNDQVLVTLKQLAKDNASSCDVEEEAGDYLFRFHADGAGPDAMLDLADKFFTAIAMPEVWRARGDNYRLDPVSPELLFQAIIQYKASDAHLCPGEAPMFRVDGDMRRSEVLGLLSAPQIMALIKEICSDKYWQEFKEHYQTSFMYRQVGMGYSRVSCFMKGGAPHVTFRFLPEIIPSFDELHIPEATMVQLARMHHGLVLVAGMTGSGKSTTVAALVDWINTNKSLHIITIENPIEYVQTNKKSFVSQRGIGEDVESFGMAVTGALRHDPDVIVIGEMRDPDTIRAAINAAASGHLVISTLHANTAYEVVNRIVSFFDPIERDLVKLQLRDSIRCVICQRLMPRIGGGRLPAIEVMFNDVKAISDNILSGESDGIRIGMQQTTSHSMIFEEYIFRTLKEGKITAETAHEYCTDESILDQKIMGTYSVPRLDSIKHTGHV
jgi:twitching motility protein PilT